MERITIDRLRRRQVSRLMSELNLLALTQVYPVPVGTLMVRNVGIVEARPVQQ
jgi:hypothetical protein